MSKHRCAMQDRCGDLVCAPCGIRYDADEAGGFVCTGGDLGVRAARLDALRKRFERFAVKEKMSVMRLADKYVMAATEAAWRGFQAGYALPRY